MTRPHLLRSLAPLAMGLGLVISPSLAAAQAAPFSDGISVGAWTFRPLLEVRVRGEYRRNPFDQGGTAFNPTAVLAEAPTTALPPTATFLQPGVTPPQVQNQYFISERARLGLAVDRGPVTAAVTLQDARVWGFPGATNALVAPGEPGSSVFAPSEAYLEVHTRSGRKVFLRVGRQKVTWGDGRLIGANDWSTTGRSLDAARFGFQAGDFDVETMAALLGTPGSYISNAQGMPTPNGPTESWGAGAALYGLDAIWHALPLLNIEAMGLARIVREPTPSTLTPSNTFVVDGRISGDRRGFRYSAEGAYELGQVASYGVNRDLRAFAFAGKASWETALPGHLTFGAEGAYASGDNGNTTGTVTRFDPILPDEHTLLSPMSLVAWSNLILGGGSLGLHPVDELALSAGYRYAALAQPGGRWTSAALYPIGAVPPVGNAPGNTARTLGHEIDGAIRVTPWKPFEIETGYGVFLCETGAQKILAAEGRAASVQHWVYLQTTVRVP